MKPTFYTILIIFFLLHHNAQCQDEYDLDIRQHQAAKESSIATPNNAQPEVKQPIKVRTRRQIRGSACLACKMAHAKCSEQKPCKRCSWFYLKCVPVAKKRRHEALMDLPAKKQKIIISPQAPANPNIISYNCESQTEQMDFLTDICQCEYCKWD